MSLREDDDMTQKQLNRLIRLEKVTGMLITWIAQSATGVISVAEAERLLKILNEDK